MDPQTNLPTLLEDLEVNIDELTTTLTPLLSTPLSTRASSLPLLDKSKLYVLTAYAIESLLFSTLQATGADAKAHAIFPELARLKGYFGKIKEIEERGVKGSAEGRAKLDVGAAGRFIKHGLSGNERFDEARRERVAREKARAQVKARQINKKFDEEGVAVGEVTPKKRGVEETREEEFIDHDDEDVLEGFEAPVADADADAPQPPSAKKPRVTVTEAMDIDSTPSSQSSTTASKSKKKKRTSRKHNTAAVEEQSPVAEDEEATNAATTPPSTRRSTRHKSATGDDDAEAAADASTPARGSKTRSAGGRGKGKGRGRGK